MSRKTKIIAITARVFSWCVFFALASLTYVSYQNEWIDAEHRAILSIENELYPLLEKIDPERQEYEKVDLKISELERELRNLKAEWAAIPAGTVIGRRVRGTESTRLTGNAAKIDRNIKGIQSQLSSTVVPSLKRNAIRIRGPHIGSWGTPRKRRDASSILESSLETLQAWEEGLQDPDNKKKGAQTQNLHFSEARRSWEEQYRNPSDEQIHQIQFEKALEHWNKTTALAEDFVSKHKLSHVDYKLNQEGIRMSVFGLFLVFAAIGLFIGESAKWGLGE